ncbi:MAG: ATP-binding protein [Anaerolineaceae bacterium]|nr:ATP-binding protein [Anaerolineaceae bacterium]
MKNFGNVVSGSLPELNIKISDKNLRNGTFAVIEGDVRKWYGTVSDITLSSPFGTFNGLSPKLSAMVNEVTSVKSGTVTLMLEENGHIAAVKTLPGVGYSVRRADQQDIIHVYGDPSDPNKAQIGGTREEDFPVCIDLNRFLERSFGVFGMSGSGKSYLLKVLLSEALRQNKTGFLIYDFHCEFANQDINPETKKQIPGLKDLHPSSVLSANVGNKTSVNGHQVDMNLMISMADILPGDILNMSDDLHLTKVAEQVMNVVYNKWGHNWLYNFMNLLPTNGTTRIQISTGLKDVDGNEIMKSEVVKIPGSVGEFADETGQNYESCQALQNRLSLFKNRNYIATSKGQSTVGQFVKALKSGKSISLSFEGCERGLDQILISNVLTRNIRNEWVNMTNIARSDRTKPLPHPLCIVIEEAHRLLSGMTAKQTTFGTIASEMRKYGITLGVVDQRPSQIASSIMSQIGTRIICSLGGSKDDIDQAVCGLANARSMLSILYGIEPKEEALIAGYGVPVAMAIKTRRYDETYWKPLLQNGNILTVPAAASQQVSSPVVQDEKPSQTKKKQPKRRGGGINLGLLSEDMPKNEPVAEVSVISEQEEPVSVEAAQPEDSLLNLFSFEEPVLQTETTKEEKKEVQLSETDSASLLDLFSM